MYVVVGCMDCVNMWLFLDFDGLKMVMCLWCGR